MSIYNKKNRFTKLKKMILSCMALCVFTTSSVFAMPEIMKLSEVKPGMQGTAYTIVDYSGERREMDVSIVGTINGGKGSEPRILATLSGPVAEEVGGLLSGMSGSPVYVDGKLVGALSATLQEMSQYTALITPIEGMLDIWKLPDKLNKTSFDQVDLKKAQEKREKDQKDIEKKFNIIEHNLAKVQGREVDNVDFGKETVELSEEKKEDTAEETAETTDKEESPAEAAAEVAEEKMTFQVGGFSKAGFDFLQETMKKSGVVLEKSSGLDISGTQEVRQDAELQPGSAVGVAAVIGDFSVGAVGTVTAVDEDKMVAFGHPFVHRGNVNFFMTDANIIGTASGPVNGMKIAENTSIIGRVNQDRNEGIAGILGVLPQSVPVIVTVKDNDLGTNVTYNSAIAYDEELLPGLSTSLAYAAMAKSIDRSSGSTATFKFAVRTDVADNGVFERKNMYYNDSDVGKFAVSELGEIMEMICSNKDAESNLLDIKVDVSIDGQRRTASIISATPDKIEAVPGDTVNFKVILKPYRKAQETVTIPYKVPITQTAGTMTVDLHGGGLISIAQLMMLQEAAMQQAITGVDVTNADADKTVTTQEKLRNCVDAYMNNEIIIEPSTTVVYSEKEQKKAIKRAIEMSKKMDKLRKEGKITEEEMREEPVSRFTTNYIIDNVVHAKINIVNAK